MWTPKFPIKIEILFATNTQRNLCSYLSTIGRNAVAVVFAAWPLNELMAFLVNKQFTLNALKALLAQTPNSIVTKCAKCFLQLKREGFWLFESENDIKKKEKIN